MIKEKKREQYRCVGCGLIVDDTPEYKEGECDGAVQHYFEKLGAQNSEPEHKTQAPTTAVADYQEA